MRAVAWLLLLSAVAVAQGSFASAAKAVRPSLVSIVTDKVQPRPQTQPSDSLFTQIQELGSGFVFDTLGHILTCSHVVAGYRDITVRFSDSAAYSGQDVVVVGLDPVTDLAVVRVRARRRFVPVRLGDSDELEVGQPVMAMGSPFGLEGTATAGIVSGLSRWGLGKSSGPDFQDFIQTDALINPGNSGGPLVDLQGRVVGINSFVRTMRSGPTGIGFATPINLAKSVADQLIAHHQVIRGLLGISSQPITEGIRQALGLRSRDGVLVTAVEPGWPGSEAGLLPGDAIVTLDGDSVPDARRFQSQIAGRAPGTTVNLGLVRKGQKKSVTATLGDWVIPIKGGPKVTRNQNWLGLVVRDTCAAEPRPGEPNCGVVITEVQGGGPGMNAGLRSGDIVCEINLAPVRDKADFGQIEKVMAGSKRPLMLRVFRGRQVFYTAVEP